MKGFIRAFLLRGLVAAGGGPIVLAIVYGILGATNTVISLSPREVCMGILTVTLLAFIVAGMGAIYQLEKLPLFSAIAIHGAVLYLTYILIYLINGWLKHQLIPILVFTFAFIAGFIIIWLIVYFVIKSKTEQINKRLNREH